MLVDDVVTKGATVFASASLLSESVRRLTLHAFALIRTQGLVDEIAEVIEPSIGNVEYRDNKVFREP